MDKHLCDTRTMANFRYSLPSSAGASAAYHGISVKCNSTSTNPPTDFLRLKLDFASMALIRHNLIPRPKTLRSTNMTSFFLPSLLIIKKKLFSTASCLPRFASQLVEKNAMHHEHPIRLTPIFGAAQSLLLSGASSWHIQDRGRC